jgi:hypothetical protein
MRIRYHLLGASLLLLAASALGADPLPSAAPPVILRGNIAAIDAKSISIKKADGTTVKVSLTAKTAFATVELRRFDQIKPTDFVGVTTVPGPNGTLVGEEVHVFSVNGVSEGSFRWDHHPEGVQPPVVSLMTNGTVAAVPPPPPGTYSMTNANVTATNGMLLKVTYQGESMVDGKCTGRAADAAGGKTCTGEAIVQVASGAPIVAIVPGKPADAKAGLALFLIALADAKGKLTASSLTIEKNGVKPQF